jgi:hypothetical protein
MFNFFKSKNNLLRYTASRTVTVMFNSEPLPTEHTAVTSTTYWQSDEWVSINRNVVNALEGELRFDDEDGNRIIVPYTSVKYIVLGPVEEQTEEV